MIQANVTRGTTDPRTLPGGDAQKPKKELEVNSDLDNIADRYNGSRTAGNYASSMLAGALKETVATIVQAPYLAFEIAKNLKKAETVGPNLTFLGTLAAVPAAILSIPVAPFYGAAKAASIVHDAQRHKSEDLILNKDTSNDHARAVFTKRDDDKARTMTGSFVNDLKELGARKLEAGEKVHDVRILAPLSFLAGGIVSGAIAGVVGLVVGIAAGAVTTVKEMAGAFTAKDKSVGARIGQFVAAPLNLLAMGPALAWNGIKEAAPRGFEDGWKHGPVKPIVDTCKSSVGVSLGVLKEAWER